MSEGSGLQPTPPGHRRAVFVILAFAALAAAALRGLAGLLRLEQTNVLRPDDPLPSVAAETDD